MCRRAHWSRAPGSSASPALWLLAAAVVSGVSGGCASRSNQVAARADASGGAQALFGRAHGLDHLGITVRDVGRAASTYEALGFTSGPGGRFPNGVDNLALFFRDTTYLELLSPYDPDLAPRLRARLEQGEGGTFVGLAVSSAEGAAAFLRSRGYAVDGPVPFRLHVKGLDEAPEVFRHVLLRRPIFPGHNIFFGEKIEQAMAELRRSRPDLRPVRDANHPNTAMGLRAVWMATNDVAGAASAYGALPLPRIRSVESLDLGVRGVEFAAGRGFILVLAPDRPDSPIAEHLVRTTYGVAGVSIEVASLARARGLLEARGIPHRAARGFYGEALLIAPAEAHGMWLELFQGPAGER